MAALLVDMDGLLVDTEGSWLVAEQQVMASLGGVWTEDDQRSVVGGPLTKMARIMLERTGSALSEEDLIALVVDAVVREHRAGPIRFMKGFPRILDEAHEVGLPVGLVSASDRVMVDAVLAAVGTHHFDVIVSGSDVTERKPHPEAYLKAAAQLGVPIEDCLILEDSPTGVAAAVASGAKVVAVPSLRDIDPHDRVRVFSSLHEVTLDDLIRAHVPC
jgi:HAD superfamily hydrolase (TIGR01509 family)